MKHGADVARRHAPLVSDTEGARLRDQVWTEMIDALRKDVPDIEASLDAIKGQVLQHP